MEGLTDWETFSQFAAEDRRKGRCSPLAFPVEVSGMDGRGRFLVERTVTSDVSEPGCRFRLKTRLQPGDVVAVRLLTQLISNPEINKLALFEIVWAENISGEWLNGAKKLQPGEIWLVAFPPHGGKLFQ